MSLVNFPKLRIKKYPRGYVVEIKKKKWWGKEYWVHIISVAGMEDTPWVFPNYEIAFKETTRLIDYYLLNEL